MFIEIYLITAYARAHTPRRNPIANHLVYCKLRKNIQTIAIYELIKSTAIYLIDKEHVFYVLQENEEL